MKELTITLGISPDDFKTRYFPEKAREFIKGMDKILESASKTIDVVFGEEYSRTKYFATDLAGNESRLVRGIALVLIEKSEKPWSKAVVVGVNAEHEIVVFGNAAQARINTSSHQWEVDFQDALQEALKNPGEYLSKEYFQSLGVDHLPTIKGQDFSLTIEQY